jgi:hypothetical protein
MVYNIDSHVANESGYWKGLKINKINLNDPRVSDVIGEFKKKHTELISDWCVLLYWGFLVVALVW